MFLNSPLALPYYVVGEVPIRVRSPEGGLHEGNSLSVFPTDGEHMSEYGNLHVSSYIKKKSLLFLSSIFSFLFFKNFPDLSLSSLCF